MAMIQFGAPTPPNDSDPERRVEIPPARYTSPEFLGLEQAHLWPRVWLVAGFAQDVRAPGDYFIFELGDESILVTCDANHNVAAFHNVCQHRGHRLCDPGMGRCDRFVCPYHNWQWGIDGALEHVPARTRFLHRIPEDRRRLAPVACHVWAGLVWVCLDKPAETLEAYLGPIHPHVAAYGPERFEINADWTAEWDCNWKTAIDGFNETYHGPATHPQFCEFLDTLSATFQFGERHSVFIIPHGVRPPDEVVGVIGEPMAGQLRRAGATPAQFTGQPDEARRFLRGWMRDEALRAGHDLSTLSDEAITDTHHFYVFPNVHIDFHGAHDLTVQRFRPHPSDPDRCFVDVTDLKRLPDVPGKARPDHITVPRGAAQRGIVYAQDIERLARVQRGLHSRGFKGAILSQLELRIGHMHQVIDDYLGAHVPPTLRTRLVPV